MAGRFIIRNKATMKRYEAEVKGDSTLIGSAKNCDIVLNKSSIDSKQCQIVKRAGKYFLINMSSKVPTLINNIKVVSPTEISNGSKITIADFELMFMEMSDNTAKKSSAKQPDINLKKVVDAAARNKNKLPKEKSSPIQQSSHQTAPSKAIWSDKFERLPNELLKDIHSRLISDLDLKHIDISKYSEDELRKRTSAAAVRIITTLGPRIPPHIPRDYIVKQIVDEALGLGPLEDLIDDERIDEIMVNGFDKIYVEVDGKIHLTNRQFTDNEHVLSVIRRIIAPLGRRIDESSPMVDARLRDGSRVNAIINPICLTGPTITIRKFAKIPFVAEDLIRFGSMSYAMNEFIKIAVKYKKNILISGGTGSGKTTLLNLVSGYIPHTERIITIEDAAELKLPQKHVISLEAKPPNIEGEGAIPIRKLVINALRMRPDRIVIGECRGGEALDMLQAMNTGHEGSLTTVHANSPRDAVSRIETMVLMSGMELPPKAIIGQIASAIHMIIHTSRSTDGKRRLNSISSITGLEGNVITLQEIFTFEQQSVDKKGNVIGEYKATGAVPTFVHELKTRGIEVDMSIFSG